MKIAIGCDHAGFGLKSAVVDYLRTRNIDVLDLGAYEYAADDSYADPAFRVGGAVADETVDAGILMCGTGYGISIAANKVPGVRAVACYSPESARIAKAHNGINVIALGGRETKPEDVPAILGAWLDTEFEGGRHLQRLEKIAQSEKSTLNVHTLSGGRITIFNHPLIQHKVGIIRSIDTSVKQFRELLNEITGLMVYEITRTLPLTEKEIQTPIEKTTVHTIEGRKMAIIPVLRAGLGMVDIEERDIFVLDPMLATGGSSSAAIELVKKRGGKRISLVCLIAAPEGIERVHKDHPDVNIFTAALDSHLNAHGYIVPGLGDAGDRLFGTK